MNCRDFNRKIFQYIDGELPDSAMEGFKIHLNTCSLCNARFLKLKMIYSVIDSDQVKDDYPYFFTRVEARYQKLKAGEHEPLFRLKPVALILAVVLPLLAGIWLGYSSFRQDIVYVDSNELIADVNNYLSTPGYPAGDYYPDPDASLK